MSLRTLITTSAICASALCVAWAAPASAEESALALNTQQPAIERSIEPAAVAHAAPAKAPVATEVDQDAMSLARILAFVKRTAGRGVSASEQRKIAETIVRYSRILGIQPELGAALISKESRFNPRASSRGYKGLGQLGASAARNMGIKNPFDIEQNIRGTLGYLKCMMDIWEGRPDRIERALASYNSGAGAVKSRGPGISRKFINGVLKNHAEILKADVPLVLSKNTILSQEKLPVE